MRIAVFTPSHNPGFLNDAYRSLCEQTLTDWEWIVVLNGDAGEWAPSTPDARVKVSRAESAKGVGAAKAVACEGAVGDILVEFDHDDLLAPTCLQEVHDAFAAHPEAVLVYSDFAQINDDLSPNHERFSSASGWEYDDQQINGTTYLRCRAMAPSPHNVSYIWYAPNHVRAFRRDAYEAVGGYDRGLEVLDGQDLMMRLYALGDFHHIPHCLYLQRMHPTNTQRDPATNRFIQEQTVRFYQERIDGIVAAWSSRHGLGRLTLTTPTSPPVSDHDPGEVIVIDPGAVRLELPDSSVGVITVTDILQRIPDRAAFFNECYRVLVHGGLIVSTTPSTDGRGAFQDPSHIAFYNENSFWYLTQSHLHFAIPTLYARFQISHIRTHFPSEWHQQNNIPYVHANLLAIKDGARQGGALLC
jgi:hypothetical protein